MLNMEICWPLGGKKELAYSGAQVVESTSLVFQMKTKGQRLQPALNVD